MSFVYTIRGPVGSDKSTIGLTIPGSKYIFDLELGVERATWRFTEAMCESRGVPYYPFETWQPPANLDLLSYSKKDRVQGQKERWDEICKLYILVLKREDIQVIMFDTAKEGWTVCHKGWLQEKQDQQLADALEKGLPEDSIKWQQTLGEFDYQTPNTRFYNIIDLAKQYGKDLILVNHEKDIYGPAIISGELKIIPTGQKELDGFRHTLDRSDWVLVTSRHEVPQENGSIRLEFSAVTTKSPIGKEIVGIEITDPTYEKFVTLASVYGYSNGLQ